MGKSLPSSMDGLSAIRSRRVGRRVAPEDISAVYDVGFRWHAVCSATGSSSYRSGKGEKKRMRRRRYFSTFYGDILIHYQRFNARK